CRPAQRRCGWTSRKGSPGPVRCARCWSGWPTKHGRRDNDLRPTRGKCKGERIMNSLDQLVLMVWLALAASAGFCAPSSAQAGELAATSARIAALGQAGKYSEATALAQRQLESIEKARVPVDRDVAGALNNLALLYS